MLKILIKKSTLEGKEKTCELIEDDCFNIYYHKNVYPNYRFEELGISLPINIPKDKVTDEIKTRYIIAMSKLFNALNYVEYHNITDLYLKGMLIQYLQEYKLPYDSNRMF